MKYYNVGVYEIIIIIIIHNEFLCFYSPSKYKILYTDVYVEHVCVSSFGDLYS